MLSTAKAKINTAIKAVRKAKWMINLVISITICFGHNCCIKKLTGLDIHKDNSAVHNIVNHRGLKCNICHIVVCMQYLKESALDGYKLVTVMSDNNIANAFTKALPAE